MVLHDPFIPWYWGANQSGMQAHAEISPLKRKLAVFFWLRARDVAVVFAWIIHKLGVHKQLVNRLLEPFMWHTVLFTATELDNFIALRNSSEAQPEIKAAAAAIVEAINDSTPTLLKEGEWHLPLIGYVPERDKFDSDEAWEQRKLNAQEEIEWAAEHPDLALKVSAGRCARVSYLTHDGVRDYNKDIELYETLVNNGHMSPAEHPATPAYEDKEVTDLDTSEGFELGHVVRVPSVKFIGNFRGWRQHRKDLPNEDDFSKVLAERAAAKKAKDDKPTIDLLTPEELVEALERPSL
jgi:hypothetical protein